ncbi:MAG: hypothetical protein H2015_02940 [Chloroflexi bacterium]|nr:hypothetical protein [Chloroflexota bacterium]|tara:strand:- start:1064 stop:1243 length:180 start_codon:yes stop_codon:yes gene_type:complete
MSLLNIFIIIIIIIYGIVIPAITVRQIVWYYKNKKNKEEPLSKNEKIKELEKQIEKLKK